MTDPDAQPNEPTTAGSFAHRPVMLDEIVALVAEVPAGVYVDATLGGAGHAAAILRSRPDLRLVGLDQDDTAVEAARSSLADLGDRAVVRRRRFDELADAVRAELADGEPVVAVLFDLGVSSPQLDQAARGFSYRQKGPLDMRMDRRRSLTADEVVNTYDEERLRRVLVAHGEDRHARRIARAIVAARPLRTTTQLAEVVRDAIPAPARRRGGHPATRTFQAIRIEVNQELAVLPDAVDQAIEVLAPGGRCLALTFHSGEDRIVKQRFLHAESGGCTCPPGLPCVCGATPSVRLLRRGGWTPSAAEQEGNPRSASARLRAVEKLGGAA
ncbi:16S rRNA (cytosine(1402)-N(4))-methyltransferase RsmH [Actinomarinicola tropica]|uniref:Ribosomal RNA small subunit methyltransferase H n=1 Tax=Actinomarinicola tropica TaxID=2789776 RepID=A0A5Q2RIC1_9ACTN|nr:16S rRNA (cytosine(1402)-N(4))-methyltransferase RsmH [Actinomarinicola tropica]QGG95553.1 16S rRNA (cytosine(1402)-N(4))-methyltransferase RsmH [Actinomarinicola tropica]